LSDHNVFYTPRGGGNGGVMPLGLFLFRIGLQNELNMVWYRVSISKSQWHMPTLELFENQATA